MTMKRWFCGLLSVLAMGCNDLTRYSTAAGESWCGSVVDASFIRSGLVSGTRLRLTFDAQLLTTSPGVLWMDPLPDGSQIQAVSLVQPATLQNDPLAFVSFGQGRVRNVILLTRGASHPLTVVVSLMQDGGMQVRVLAPGADESSEVFGLFTMTKQLGTCGF